MSDAMSETFEVITARDSSDARVQLQIDDRVARIILNNPPLNMLSLDMMGAISEAINLASRERGVCAVVFEPAPKCRAFSAGIAMEDHRPEVAYQVLEAFHGIF